MNVEETALDGVLLLRPPVYRDARGFFRETWRADRYAAHGITREFVQDNVSLSGRGVLRGLHFQQPRPQGKLVTVLRGAVWDVAVDVRVGSPTFGEWVGYTLSAENGQQLWIPEGFAHGFVVTSEEALVAYKCTEVYHPAGDRVLRHDDPELAIRWPCDSPTVSERDAGGLRLAELPADWLPAYGAEGAGGAAATAATPGDWRIHVDRPGEMGSDG